MSDEQTDAVEAAPENAAAAEHGAAGDVQQSVLDVEVPEGEVWTPPEGVEVPPHLLGASAEDTVARLAKAYLGARQALAKKGQGDGAEASAEDVPADPAAYVIEPEGEDDVIAKALEGEESQKVLDAFREAAIAAKIPPEAFAEFIRTGLSKAAELGVPITPEDAEQVAQVTAEAEFEQLVERVGPRQATGIIQMLKAQAEKFHQLGLLRDEQDIAEFKAMLGTARAAEIWYRIATNLMSERPVMPDSPTTSDNRAELLEAHAEAVLAGDAEKAIAIERQLRALDRQAGM